MHHSLWGAKMTNVVEPRTAADSDDNELASLVRRWMGVRRGGAQRAEPEPPDAAATSGTTTRAERPVVVPDAPSGPAAVRALPRRPAGGRAGPARRLAVLIDARRISADAAAGLLDAAARTRLGHGVPRLRRLDGLRPRCRGSSTCRRQGLHSFHQFADDDDQARVALAIDAVDIAREAAVDEVVLAGDMTSCSRCCTACTPPAYASWWSVPGTRRTTCGRPATSSWTRVARGRAARSPPGGTAPETGRASARAKPFAHVAGRPTLVAYDERT